MGRFTRMMDDAMNEAVQDFEARAGRRMTYDERRDILELRKYFKSRLNQLGPTEGSAMFEEAKQRIVDEAIARFKKYFENILNPSEEGRDPILIRNPEGDIVIGEPAPRPAPVPPRWGFPVDGDIRGPRFPIVGRPVDTIQPIRPPVDTNLPTRPTVPQIPQVNMFPDTIPRL